MRRREFDLEVVWKAMQRLERRIIRVLVLASVLLVLVQFALFTNPLDFYFKMTAKIEESPLEIPVLAEPRQSWQLTLRATPAAPVRILQNGIVLGTLANGEKQITVEAGQIQLDGRGLSQPIQVQVIDQDSGLLEPRANQIIVIQGNVQTLQIKGSTN